MVKNLPVNAGDMGSIPGPETQIPHVLGQLNPCAATTEAGIPYSPCSVTREATAVRSPRIADRE